MHASVRSWFLPTPLRIDEITDKDVLEVGSLDVNGTIRALVEALRPASYLGIDVVDGPGVDRVLDVTAVTREYGREAFDAVICCETMEHVEDWRAVMAAMWAVLRPGGVLIVTTRSIGFSYHHPPDRWRYTQDSFRQITDVLGMELRSLFDDPEHPGVFWKARKPVDEARNLPLPTIRTALGTVEGVTPVRQPVRLLGLPAHVDGCGYYRMWQPFTAMQRAGMADVFIPPPGEERFWPTMEQVEHFQVIVQQRPHTRAVADAWEWWKAKTDVKLVFEADDNLISPDTSLQGWRNPAVTETARRCLKLADMVTTSTERLAEAYRAETDAPVVVLPNRIHRDLLSLREPRDADRVTLGFAGGQTHFRDLMVIRDPLNRVLDRYPELDMRWAGYDDPAAAFGDRGTFHKWEVDIWEYYRVISEFDVGIIPLRSTPFNDCRSAIKALEYAALGIPVVASNVPAYSGFVDQGRTGFLADNPPAPQADLQWNDFLGSLIVQPGLRKIMGDSAHELAQDHTIQEHWTAWADAYQSLVAV